MNPHHLPNFELLCAIPDRLVYENFLQTGDERERERERESHRRRRHHFDDDL